ncbi:MAG: hypothetical protein ACP5NV_03335 [Candidatus Woesearchaeota archaeon]
MIKKTHQYLKKHIKNFDMKKISYAEFKHFLIISLIIAIVFAVFTKSIIPFLGLFFGFLVIIYIPGYALASLLLKEWGTLEKSIIALFLGMAPGPIIVYALSSLNIHALTIGFSIFIAVISIIIILFTQQENPAPKQ